MSRISPMFESFARRGRKALVPYVTAGDPAGAATVPLMHAMVEAGADIIELGVPFSDPMADGPVIQRAGERALAAGVNLAGVLGYVREFRARDTTTPIVLMGYANPIEQFEFRHGKGGFVAAAHTAGVDGLIVVDYPPEECAEFAAALRAAGMDLIFLLAPTSTEARIDAVAKLASGYLYYVSLAGVTGADHLQLDDVLRRVGAIRARCALPVGVGFGIRDGATARAIGATADAVIIGSRLIREMEEGTPAEAAARVAAFLRGVRKELDR